MVSSLDFIRPKSRFAKVFPVGVAGILLIASASVLEAASITVPRGTKLQVTLIDTLSTSSNREGEKFQAVLNSDLHVEGRKLAATGSRVQGRIVELKKPIRVMRKGRMSLVLANVEIGGVDYAIKTSRLELEAQRDGSVAADVATGAYTGGVIGAAAGNALSNDPQDTERLAAIGAAAGAILVSKKNHLEIKPGASIAFYLEESFSVNMNVITQSDKTGNNQVGNFIKDDGIQKDSGRQSVGGSAREVVALLKEIRLENAEIKLEIRELRRELEEVKKGPANNLATSFITLIFNPTEIITEPAQKHPFLAAMVLYGLPLFLAIFSIRASGGSSKTFFYLYSAFVIAVVALASLVPTAGSNGDQGFFNTGWLAGGISSILMGVITDLIADHFRGSMKAKDARKNQAQQGGAVFG